MEKFQKKYRIPSNRWASWDYSSNAAYFVTICTIQESHDFGEISFNEMKFTPLGQAAVDCWLQIPDHFPDVYVDGFVVMPNHVHGIVIINKSSVETQNFASLQKTAPQTSMNKFGPQSRNLASIIRGYKIGVTKFARQNGIPFVWQPRYYDHVIRNEDEYRRVWQYIHDNPQRWSDDKFHNS